MELLTKVRRSDRLRNLLYIKSYISNKKKYPKFMFTYLPIAILKDPLTYDHINVFMDFYNIKLHYVIFHCVFFT